MTDVLISYARRDRGVAARLAAQLAERGLKAVWDVSELPEGALLESARRRAGQAPAVVTLWTDASARSIWVRDEAADAERRHAHVAALVDGTPCPVTASAQVDLAAWAENGAEAGLDSLIAAIARAANESYLETPAATPERAAAPTQIPAPAAAPSAEALINSAQEQGEAAAGTAFFAIAWLFLLGLAVASHQARVPAPLPPIDQSATEPFDVPVILPNSEDENAPSGLRPVPHPAQDSTGSVKK